MHDDFQAGETRGNCSSISQWCQPLTTTMTEKVRFLKWLYLYCHILTDLRSLLAYEPGIILYLWKWKKQQEGFFSFLSKTEILTEDKLSYSFVHASYNAARMVSVIWGRTLFPYFTISELWYGLRSTVPHDCRDTTAVACAHTLSQSSSCCQWSP